VFAVPVRRNLVTKQRSVGWIEEELCRIVNVPPDDYLLGTGEALEPGEADPTAQEVAVKPGKVVEVKLVVP
jgi:hypothetical protein